MSSSSQLEEASCTDASTEEASASRPVDFFGARSSSSSSSEEGGFLSFFLFDFDAFAATDLAVFAAMFIAEALFFGIVARGAQKINELSIFMFFCVPLVHDGINVYISRVVARANNLLRL